MREGIDGSQDLLVWLFPQPSSGLVVGEEGIGSEQPVVGWLRSESYGQLLEDCQELKGFAPEPRAEGWPPPGATRDTVRALAPSTQATSV